MAFTGLDAFNSVVSAAKGGRSSQGDSLGVWPGAPTWNSSRGRQYSKDFSGQPGSGGLDALPGFDAVASSGSSAYFDPAQNSAADAELGAQAMMATSRIQGEKEINAARIEAAEKARAAAEQRSKTNFFTGLAKTALKMIVPF